MSKTIKNILRKPSIIYILNLFFLKYLKLKKILSPEIPGPGRFFMAGPDDIFIISYPKSGNTWLRFLIANLIFEKEKVNLSNLTDFIGDLGGDNEKKLLNQRKPRIFNSHDYFDPRFKKVIYMVRDPRDVLTSLYFYLTSLGTIKKNYSKSQFVKRFLEGEFDANFGSWNENVGSWININDKNKIIIIKYEDLKKNSYKEINKICKFLKVKKSKKKISEAIKKSSFEKLRKMENVDLGFTKYFSDSNPGFFRKGKIGDWKNFLSKKESNKIRKLWKTNMKYLGYY